MLTLCECHGFNYFVLLLVKLNHIMTVTGREQVADDENAFPAVVELS